MKPQTSIFDEADEEAEAAAEARAEADAEAGRVVGHEAVSRWLLTWGTGKRTPRPKCRE